MSVKWKCYKKPFRDTWIRAIRSPDNMQISDTVIRLLLDMINLADGVMEDIK